MTIIIIETGREELAYIHFEFFHEVLSKVLNHFSLQDLAHCCE